MPHVESVLDDRLSVAHQLGIDVSVPGTTKYDILVLGQVKKTY
jgi:hypothetical protein